VIWRHKVDTLHDFGGSTHKTHQFSLCQRGSKAFHDPQLQTHVVHTGINMRLTFLLSVSASVSCTGCHCGAHVRAQMDNFVLFDWILHCVDQPLDAYVCSVQHQFCSVQSPACNTLEGLTRASFAPLGRQTPGKPHKTPCTMPGNN